MYKGRAASLEAENLLAYGKRQAAERDTNEQLEAARHSLTQKSSYKTSPAETGLSVDGEGRDGARRELSVARREGQNWQCRSNLGQRLVLLTCIIGRQFGK